jgi:hypothetical protein
MKLGVDVINKKSNLYKSALTGYKTLSGLDILQLNMTKIAVHKFKNRDDCFLGRIGYIYSQFEITGN